MMERLLWALVAVTGLAVLYVAAPTIALYAAAALVVLLTARAVITGGV